MLPQYVAEKKGFYKKHGLDVVQQVSPDSATALAGLGKQYDFIPVSATTFLSGAEKGMKNVAFASVVADATGSPSTSLIMSPKWSFNSYRDLEGATIAITTLGSSPMVATNYLVDQDGGDSSKVKWVKVSANLMFDQVKAGRVDGAMALVPFGDQFTQAGYKPGRVVMVDAFSRVTGKAVEAVPSGTMATTAEIAERNPEVLRDWQAATDEAIQWIHANDKEARQMLQEWAKISPEVANAASFPKWISTYSVADLRGFIALLKATGSDTGNLPEPSTLVWDGK
jgi:NitT/TauT family transport system substrate-binding protein